MAYELTAAAATTANPYVIVGAAIIDTIRANANKTTTSKGKGLQQNQLSAENFSSYITDALGGSGMKNRGTNADRTFSDAVVKRGSGVYSQITAATSTTNNDSQTEKRSIICTTMVELGELSPYVYAAGICAWESKNPRMMAGYYRWGYPVASLCRRNTAVRKVCGYFARSRYLYLLFGQWNLAGWMTVHIGEPICFLIGARDGNR